MTTEDHDRREPGLRRRADAFSRAWSLVSVAPALVLGAACAGPDQEGDQPTHISFQEAPLTLVDAGSPPELSELGLFRVAALAAVPSTGQVAILDAGNQRVILWDPAEASVLSIGREGSGPGEFRRPVSIWASAHHVFVEDRGKRTMEVFRTDGGHVGSVPFAASTVSGQVGVVGELGAEHATFVVPDHSSPDGRIIMGIEIGAGEVRLLAPTGETPAAAPGGDEGEESGPRQVQEVHPLLSGTSVPRWGSETFPLSADMYFRVGELTMRLDQRGGTLSLLLADPQASRATFLPDQIVQAQVDLIERYRAEGRDSPLTFARTIADALGDRVFLPRAGDQESLLGWSLDVSSGPSFTMRPLRYAGTGATQVSSGIWLDDGDTLLVGHEGGVGLLRPSSPR